jgi:hypothetical protein
LYFLNIVSYYQLYSERVTGATTNILLLYEFRKLNVCCGLEGSRFNSPAAKLIFYQMI